MTKFLLSSSAAIFIAATATNASTFSAATTFGFYEAFPSTDFDPYADPDEEQPSFYCYQPSLYSVPDVSCDDADRFFGTYDDGQYDVSTHARATAVDGALKIEKSIDHRVAQNTQAPIREIFNGHAGARASACFEDDWPITGNGSSGIGKIKLSFFLDGELL